MKNLKIIWIISCLLMTVNGFGGEDSLYYRIENVTIVSSLRGYEHLTTPDKSTDKTKKEKGTETVVRKDAFLVPYIKDQAVRLTEYKSATYTKKKIPVTKSSVELVISINVFDDNLEYQLHLNHHKTKEAKDTSSSFFINPDDPNHKEVIKLELQRLFEDRGSKNEKPNGVIRLDGKLVKKPAVGTPAKVFYRSNSDTIIIDASSSYDKETPSDLLTYKWTVKKDGVADPGLSNFNFTDKYQKVSIKEPGKYTFQVGVDDGITVSDRTEIELIITVEKDPKLELYSNHLKVTYQKGLFNFFGGYGRNGLMNREFKSGFSTEEVKKESKMFIQYEYSLKGKSGENTPNKNFLESRNHYRNSPVIFDHISNYCQIYYPGYIPFPAEPVNFLINKKIPGIQFKQNSYELDGDLTFSLDDDIEPGTHKYSVYTDYKGIQSNVDTIEVTYREKNVFYVEGGYGHTSVGIGNKRFDDYGIDFLNLGFRFYFIQRLSAIVHADFPIRTKVFTGFQNETIRQSLLSFAVNYDVFPLKKSVIHTQRIPTYLSFFGAGNQLIVGDDLLTISRLQLGG
ncbi:MAG: hypothetical protein MI810_23695, partial [Flavobacteriales bacterium]|nr:hypothetical protein [Flavobacteriales bacterium]